MAEENSSGGLLSGVGNFLGQVAPAIPLVGSLFDMASQANTNKANMKLAEYQWQKNLEMWNLTNEYNNPRAQMERLKAAGLNPNMVYGSGSAANQAASAPSYQAPRLQAYTRFGNNFSAAAQSILNSQMTASQIKNMELQNKLLQYDAQIKSIEADRKHMEFTAYQEDYPSERSYVQNRAAEQHWNAIRAQMLTDKQLIDNDIRRVDLDIIQQKFKQEMLSTDILQEDRNNYLELGVKPSDPLWVRVIANVIFDVLGKTKAKDLLGYFLDRYSE